MLPASVVQRPRVVGTSHPALVRKLGASAPVQNLVSSALVSPGTTNPTSVLSSSQSAAAAAVAAAYPSMFTPGNYPSLRIEEPKPFSYGDLRRDERVDLFLIHIMNGKKHQAVEDYSPAHHFSLVCNQSKTEEGMQNYRTPSKQPQKRCTQS